MPRLFLLFVAVSLVVAQLPIDRNPGVERQGGARGGGGRTGGGGRQQQGGRRGGECPSDARDRPHMAVNKIKEFLNNADMNVVLVHLETKIQAPFCGADIQLMPCGGMRNKRMMEMMDENEDMMSEGAEQPQPLTVKVAAVMQFHDELAEIVQPSNMYPVEASFDMEEYRLTIPAIAKPIAGFVIGTSQPVTAGMPMMWTTESATQGLAAKLQDRYIEMEINAPAVAEMECKLYSMFDNMDMEDKMKEGDMDMMDPEMKLDDMMDMPANNKAKTQQMRAGKSRREMAMSMRRMHKRENQYRVRKALANLAMNHIMMNTPSEFERMAGRAAAATCDEPLMEPMTDEQLDEDDKTPFKPGRQVREGIAMMACGVWATSGVRVLQAGCGARSSGGRDGNSGGGKSTYQYDMPYPDMGYPGNNHTYPMPDMPYPDMPYPEEPECKPDNSLVDFRRDRMDMMGMGMNDMDDMDNKDDDCASPIDGMSEEEMYMLKELIGEGEDAKEVIRNGFRNANCMVRGKKRKDCEAIMMMMEDGSMEPECEWDKRLGMCGPMMREGTPARN
eukprot:TRINITY_DN67355_c2_g1_i10.p1 TRINITY_DN67355_c2_g1~~TRINITY_DN67355_c2_g1_i10.p1  ORF type:complete len:566 (-),score=128.75 TRINITY_DN67355_c2_g1_i10:1851-3527(-)